MKLDIRYILICVLLFGLAACADELFSEGNIIPDGESTLSVAVDFQPMAAGLNGAKTRSAGNSLDDIEHLVVLLYGEDRRLIESFEVNNFVANDVPRTDADAENNKTAESQTKRATFDLTIPYGRYYIYAVANVPKLLENEEYKAAIQNVDGLKSLPLTWDETEKGIRNNSQMLGYFTLAEKMQPEETPLDIDKKNLKLHSWLRRAASKITVSYDGRQLKDGVFVYIKSVQIKDIPKQCYLGKENKVGDKGYTLSNDLIADGEKLIYYTGNEPTVFDQDYKGPRITKGKPYYGSHHEDSVAMFFYENVQGIGKDKRQDADGDRVLDAPGLPGDATYKKKDSKEYGTYIEVDAYYVSINSQKLGSGPIKYRFMLGQNVTDDYNALRNYHYKLTLKFKNFANDVDWHIEYKEPEPGVITPDPYYISYLYNHDMMYPIKINTGGHKIESIMAKIVDNEWHPNTTDKGAYYTGLNEKEGDNLWNGFLSLHKTTATVIEGSEQKLSIESNKVHYEAPPHRGEREYKEFKLGENTTLGAVEGDVYRVEKDSTDDDTYNVFIPMYTRAKQLIKTTAYTGNNLFVAYQRKAKVAFTVKLEGVPAFVDTVTIYQVRRIVNPKGIYRAHDKQDDFHVSLKRLPQENATQFESFPSEGAWRAYIVRWCNSDDSADRVINLESTTEYSVLRRDTIWGDTGSDIDFKVKFNGTCNADESRYAIIRVEYHNYTCQHLIFVRQGDSSDDLIAGGTKWHAKNMKTKTEETANPLEEGSLFKRGNWDYPIDALNNKNPKTYWVDVKPGDFGDESWKNFTIAGSTETKTWSQIDAIGDFIPPKTGWRVADEADYQALYDEDDIEQGYGVLYGSEARETLEDLNEVYGYDYKDATGTHGMRGCFVYNKATGKNLFFPIGASGYGHRKNGLGENGNVAVLRYAASRSSYFPEGQIGDGSVYPHGIKDAPLFYDIYMRPGALYWFGNKAESSDVGWDFNYFSFDFYPISNYATNGGQDACFVRCVDAD